LAPPRFAVEPGQKEVVITHILEAPRERVYQAYSDPKLLPYWRGSRDIKMTVDQHDLRPGGAWRYLSTAPDGQVFAFRGTFREIVPPERLSWTFEFEMMMGRISTQTVVFEDLGGKTRITVTAVFPSVEDRDGMLKQGMEQGYTETMDRLAGLLLGD